MFVVIVGLSIGWVVLYARKVRKNPELSLTFHDDKQKRLDMGAVDDDVPFTTAQKWILVVFLAGMALIVWGLVSQGWYMSELSAVFRGDGPSGRHYRAVLAAEDCPGVRGGPEGLRVLGHRHRPGPRRARHCR